MSTNDFSSRESLGVADGSNTGATIEAPRSYPALLVPFVTRLPARDAGWLGRVQYSRPVLTSWNPTALRPSDTKGGKPLVAVKKEPCFGEMAFLRAFEAEGWEGRWIDNYPLPQLFARRTGTQRGISWRGMLQTKHYRQQSTPYTKVFVRKRAIGGAVALGILSPGEGGRWPS